MFPFWTFGLYTWLHGRDNYPAKGRRIQLWFSAPAPLINPFPAFFLYFKMATAYPLTDQLDSESEHSKEDNHFHIVMSPKERKAKRKRKASILSPIENLTRSNTSSESDNPDTEFQTPMKQGLNKDTQPQDLNILIRLPP